MKFPPQQQAPSGSGVYVATPSPNSVRRVRRRPHCIADLPRALGAFGVHILRSVLKYSENKIEPNPGAMYFLKGLQGIAFHFIKKRKKKKKR